MDTHRLGKTGHRVSVIGLGTGQFGGDWGDVSEDEALATLHAAADAGVTFFDTADVYATGAVSAWWDGSSRAPGLGRARGDQMRSARRPGPG